MQFLPYSPDESEALSKEAYQQALNLLEGVEDKLSRYVELSEEAEDLLDTTEAEALNKKTSDSQREHGSKLMMLRVKIAKKAPKEKEAKTKVKDEQGTGEDSAKIAEKEPVKIKPIECPTWDGIKFEFSVEIKNQWDKLARP